MLNEFGHANRAFQDALNRMEAQRSALRLLREQGALPSKQASARRKLLNLHQEASRLRKQRDALR